MSAREVMARASIWQAFLDDADRALAALDAAGFVVVPIAMSRDERALLQTIADGGPDEPLWTRIDRPAWPLANKLEYLGCAILTFDSTNDILEARLTKFGRAMLASAQKEQTGG